MNKITFNKSNIESIETPLKRSVVYSNEMKGLHLETFNSGTKTFRLAYKFNNSRYVYTIGQFPTIHPNQAIKIARELKQSVYAGVNPQQDRILERKEPTYLEYFLNDYIPLKISHYEEYKDLKTFIDEDTSPKNINRIRYNQRVNKGLETLVQNYNSKLRNHSFCNKRMKDISPLDIHNLFLDISEKQTANQLMRQLRNIFEFYNPLNNPVKVALKKFIKLHTTKERIRKATEEELIRLGNALNKIESGFLMDNGFYYQPQKIQAIIIRVCLFEGMRPNEIYSMKWEEIKGSRYKTQSKTGDIETELTFHTLNELNKLNRDCDYVFVGNVTKKGIKPNSHIKSIRKTWHKACELANITDLELYDLRKTFSSNATQIFGLFDSSKLTNHKSTKVVEKHYSHLDSGETKLRKDQLSNKFNNLLNGGGKVVNIG
ncbi:integrase family protein [Alphaproteobacteria bacterium]|nr:integrase family protein [Alphaproteobacteria bacterium]